MDQFMADVIKLGHFAGTLSGSHAYIKSALTNGELDAQSPVVQGFLAGLGAVGERPKHKQFRSSMKKFGITFDQITTSKLESCYSCWGRGTKHLWANGSYQKATCKICGGSGKLEVHSYPASINGRRISDA